MRHAFISLAYICAQHLWALAQLSVSAHHTFSWLQVLVGADRNRDLVVLRINAPPEQLQPVTLGTSADLQVGQQVKGT